MRGGGEGGGGGYENPTPPPPEHYPVENVLVLASAMTKSPIDVISGIFQNFKSKQGLRL